MVGPDMVRLLAAGGLVVLLACLVSFAELLAAHCCGLGLQSGIHACWQMLSCPCLELMAVAGLHTGLADWLSPGRLLPMLDVSAVLLLLPGNWCAC